MKKSLLLALAFGVTLPLAAENVTNDANGNVIAVEDGAQSGPVVDTRASNWTPVGSGTFIESFFDYVEYYFEEYWEPEWKSIPVGEELTVEFEQNDDVPGVFRLVNPYAKWTGATSAPFSYDSLHNYYIVINASDPEYVYIESGENGVLCDGEMTKIHSNINTFVQMYGKEMTQEFYPTGGGKLINGVLTFPVDVEYSEGVKMLVHAVGNIFYTSCPANGTGHLEIVFPEGAVVNNPTVEAAPAEYFNLNGVRISHPDRGIYIMRQGDTVKKIII